MTGEVYSTAKALWHWEQMQSLKDGKQPNPVHVQLIISDSCNHYCGFCAYRKTGYTSNQLFGKNPKRMIPYDKCIEIIDDCQELGVKAIQFTGGGEPTIHPEFSEIAQYAMDCSMEGALVTNGSMLHKDDVISAIRRMAWVRVSIDASNVNTYCRIRQVSRTMWHRMIDGLKGLCQDKRDLVVGAGFVVTPDNWREMVDACHLFKSLGVDNVRLGLMFNSNGAKPYESFKDEMIALSEQAVRECNSPSFTVISRVAEKLSELEQGHPGYKDCWYQHFTTYIGGDLNVYRCCVYAYNKRGLIGSLKDQRFIDLWESYAKRVDFDSFTASGCERCQFNIINQTIDKALKEPPLHVNYV